MNHCVISLVEKGWAGARQLTLRAAGQGRSIHHLVKGKLPRELIAALTPCPGMTIRGFSVRWYRWVVWARLWVARGRLASVLVDNERAIAWVEKCCPGVPVFLAQESDEGAPQLFRQGRAVEPGALWGGGS